VARAEIMDSLPANSISTFGGSPVTTAGALANLTYLLDNDLQGNARRVGGWLIERLRALMGAIGIVGDVRGKGLMIGVELVQPGTGAPSAAAATAALEAARRRGLLAGKGGLYGNVLRIAPPLSLTQDEAEEGAEILAAALADAAADVAPTAAAEEGVKA
jgi:4-aminobutyrate aminotransferase